MTRVLIAVPDPIASIGLAAILAEAEDLACLPVPERLDDVRGLVSEHRPDVLILGVALRRADARLIPDLLEAQPDLHVLVYVDHTIEDCGVRRLLERSEARLSVEALAKLDDCCLASLRRQASGCLATGTGPADVLETVRTVARGEIAATPWLTAVASAIAAEAHAPGDPKPISPRELEVMSLLGEGLSNRHIAERLNIHEQTVKNHVTRLLEKLEVESRLEVGLLAARHRIRVTED